MIKMNLSKKEQKAIDYRLASAKDLAKRIQNTNDLAKKLQSETRCSVTIAHDLASQIVIGKISIFEAKRQARESKEDK